MAIRMTFYSVVLTAFMCVVTVSRKTVSTKGVGSSVDLKSLLLSWQTKNKESLGNTIGAMQQSVVKLEQALANTADESIQQDLRNEIGEYYYRIAKMFSELTDDQCLTLLADNRVLLLFQDTSRPAKDIITENAIFALRASLGFRENSYEAKRLLSELEARSVSNDAEPVRPDLKAMNVVTPDFMAMNAREEGDQPIDTVIAGYQQSIVKIEQLLETPEGQNMKHELKPMLGDLYYRVGKMLGEATDEECTELVREKKIVLIIDEETSLAKDIILENAFNALRTSLFYRPGNAEVENTMEQLKAAATKSSPKMMKMLFDQEADMFDKHLAFLQYASPEHVASEVGSVVKQRGRPFASALDAGCGTGLVGPLIREYIDGALIGTDLSPKMLTKAQTRSDEKGLPVYDELVAGDLLTMDVPKKPFELVVSADVLVYFGDLGPVLSRFKSLLAPDGVLIFTCERGETSPTEWTRLSSDRFSHGRQYVEETALSTGLRLVDYRETVPRMEALREVPGHLFVFKNGDD